MAVILMRKVRNLSWNLRRREAAPAESFGVTLRPQLERDKGVSEKGVTILRVMFFSHRSQVRMESTVFGAFPRLFPFVIRVDVSSVDWCFSSLPR